MNELNKIDFLKEFPAESLLNITGNLLLCILLLCVVSWFYRKFSSSLGGKSSLAIVLPLIGLTVFLVIVVVKSSLALSLGLVGALSIVRFRTPIKEPEELGYLFLAIAVGLGFGAGFKSVTILVVLLTLMYLWVSRVNKNITKRGGEYTAVISLSDDNIKIDEIIHLMESFVLGLNLNRIDTSSDKSVLFFNISVDENFSAQEMINAIKKMSQKIEFQMIEYGVNF